MHSAYSLVPHRFADGRHTAIEQGIASLGYEVKTGFEAVPGHKNDVLITWNAHLRGTQPSIKAFKEAGARVIVCEEAYTRRLYPPTHFAMALSGHNGSGEWDVGDESRWDRLGIDIKPWRADGEHILVCAQRGMGSPEMAEPKTWHTEVINRLRATTRRPIVLRRHPGKAKANYSLASQLVNCWAVVVWASNCATQALVNGIPVFYEAPHIVTCRACHKGIEHIENPAYPSRKMAFNRLAWAQWDMEEIRDGTAFRHLLHQSE